MSFVELLTKCFIFYKWPEGIENTLRSSQGEERFFFFGQKIPQILFSLQDSFLSPQSSAWSKKGKRPVFISAAPPFLSAVNVIDRKQCPQNYFTSGA